MNWLNLNIQTLDSENFLGSDPIERGTWLCLLRYCIGQENGGRIIGCAGWPDRKWQQLVRITKKEAAKSCDLWKWEDDSLIVWGYPAEKESEVRQKRDHAKTNGLKGGRPKKTECPKAAEPNTAIGDETGIGCTQEPTSVNSAKAEGERKGKEGEGEGNGNKEERDTHARRPTLEQAKAAAANIGISPDKADEWWHVREASEWVKGMAGGGISPVGPNWQADLKTYSLRGGQSIHGLKPDHRQRGYNENLQLP